MTIQTNMSAAMQDHEDYLSARDTNHKDLLVYAAKSSGRSVFQIQREFKQMAKSHSRLNMVEYVRTGLYRHDDYSAEDRAAYISNDLHWEMTHLCNNQSWSSVAEDKALAGTFLTAGGVPVPQSVGVIDKSPRLYPDLAKITSADELRDVVLANMDSGLFGKIVDGMISFGAFRVDAADDTHLTCAGHEPMTYEQFMTDFVADNAYVLQRNLKNHPDIARYAPSLATVRMVNMVKDDQVYCPMAVIKLPQGKNIADAFWRPGNLASEVDVETGKILTVAERAGLEVAFHDDHPNTPGLKGLQLPYWKELREINAKAARLFAPIRYQSTDIAITEDGPVVVELNYGGGFDLPQYACGRGMLNQEVRTFFEGHGWSFNAGSKKKRSFFGKKAG